MSTIESSRAYRAQQEREQIQAAREWDRNNKEFIEKCFNHKEHGQDYRRVFYLGLAEGERNAYMAAREEILSQVREDGIL